MLGLPRERKLKKTIGILISVETGVLFFPYMVSHEYDKILFRKTLTI